MDAQDAKEKLHLKNFGGLKINIEWSKKSGKFDPRESQKRVERRFK